jgi:hypothetical protein
MTVTAPNTLSVAQAIQTIAQALSFSAIGSITGYNTVSIGAKKDVTNLLPLLEITGADDETERESQAAVGSQLEVGDYQLFQLTTTADYTDSAVGEQVIFALRDVLTKAFQTSASLNHTTGVIGVYLDKGRYAYAMRNGVWCRMHQTKVKVAYWYEPTMTA